MATTEPLTGARVPQQSDGPLGGLQIANAVNDLAPVTLPRFTSTAARDIAYTNWVNAGHTLVDGMVCTAAGVLYEYKSGAWGPLNASGLRLTSTSDASATSTGHAFQVGPDNATNIIIDQNEIIARNNGVTSQLILSDNASVTVPEPTVATGAATKNYVDTRPKAKRQAVAGWTNATYGATSNFNLKTLTINPGYPWVAIVTATGVFNPGAGSNASLRILGANLAALAVSTLNQSKTSAECVKTLSDATGAALTLTANLEVLAGAVTAYADGTHSYLEAIVMPL